MTPATALKLHRDHLSEYEQSEVLEYPQIWYTGAGAQKVRGSPVAGNQNHGYDDERGDYTIVPHDHFAYRHGLTLLHFSAQPEHLLSEEFCH